MNKEAVKSKNMTSYLIKSKILDYLPEVIEEYQKDFDYKFNKEDISEIMAIGEEMLDTFFPTTAYNFTLKKKETEAFDDFIGEFVAAFVGVLLRAVRAHMHILQISAKLDEIPDEAA